MSPVQWKHAVLTIGLTGSPWTGKSLGKNSSFRYPGLCAANLTARSAGAFHLEALGRLPLEQSP